jgi:hypothetical protein
VFWVHAGTQARVEEGFRTIADTVKMPGRNEPKADIPQLVYRWLSNQRNGRWIIILDSADDRDVFYRATYGDTLTSGDVHNGQPFATYLPQSQNGSMVITTRNKRRGLFSRWKNKTRIVWNEGEMRSYLSLLHGQQSAVAFLVQVLHM